MASMQKFGSHAVGHIYQHTERAKDEHGNYVAFGNGNIDEKRTHLNYNLATEQQMSQMEFQHKRLSEVKVLNRADVKKMCSWIITKPQDLPPEKESDFFKESYNFLTQRYGKNNVVSAYVHKDEKTPHMHYCFLPITTDKKTGKEKLSAKEVINKKDLTTFHRDLQDYLQKSLKCKVNVIKEPPEDSSKTVKQLKREAEFLAREISETAQTLQKKKGLFGREKFDEEDIHQLQATVDIAVRKANTVYKETEEFSEKLSKEWDMFADMNTKIDNLEKKNKQLTILVSKLRADNQQQNSQINDLKATLKNNEDFLQQEVKNRLKEKLEPLRAIADDPYMPQELSDELKQIIGIPTAQKRQQEIER